MSDRSDISDRDLELRKQDKTYDDKIFDEKTCAEVYNDNAWPFKRTKTGTMVLTIDRMAWNQYKSDYEDYVLGRRTTLPALPKDNK